MTCKITHDGVHYVASATGHFLFRRKNRPRKPTPRRTVFKNYYNGTRAVLSRAEQRREVFHVLGDTFGYSEDLLTFVDDEFKREDRNYQARKKRLEKKTFLNQWNYFCTFTYDDAKITVDEFEKKLRCCLSHVCFRRGWRYMMVRELSPEKERVHYHGLFYIPEGEMVGSIRPVSYWDTKRKQRRIAHVNDWFEQRFGRNDFEAVHIDRVTARATVSYLLKYLRKTGGRVIYSRRVPTEIVEDIIQDQCVCEFYNFGRKWVLFDEWKAVEKMPAVLKDDAAVEWLVCFYNYDRYGQTNAAFYQQEIDRLRVSDEMNESEA